MITCYFRLRPPDMFTEMLTHAKGRLPEKKRLFFYKSYKGGGSFPFIKIYVADFV